VRPRARAPSSRPSSGAHPALSATAPPRPPHRPVSRQPVNPTSARHDHPRANPAAWPPRASDGKHGSTPVGHLPARHPPPAPRLTALGMAPRHRPRNRMHHWTAGATRAGPRTPTSPPAGTKPLITGGPPQGAACHRLRAGLSKLSPIRRPASTPCGAPGCSSGWPRFRRRVPLDRHDHGSRGPSMTWWPRARGQSTPQIRNVMPASRGNIGRTASEGSGRSQSIRCAPQPGIKCRSMRRARLTVARAAGSGQPDRSADPESLLGAVISASARAAALRVVIGHW